MTSGLSGRSRWNRIVGIVCWKGSTTSLRRSSMKTRLPPTKPLMPSSPVATSWEGDAQAVAEALRATIRGDVFVDAVSRGVYATDASLFQVMPECVVVPRDQADVLAAIRVANQHRLPITARGGGTSLSGQTYGPGMVLDVSKYMDAVVEVDAEAGWARVQPGVIRDRLNAAVASHRLHFAPDPATGSRATIGGMVGNNTCGTRSLVYGKTIDHVLACRVALADGTVCEFEAVDEATWEGRSHAADARDPAASAEARLYRGVAELIGAHRDAIRERYPKVLRRVSGYNLDEFVDGAGYTGTIGPRHEQNQGHPPWNLSNLIVGSEGTLAILLEAKVRLTPLPQATALCVVHFETLQESLRAVDAMLEHDPSTVELLDQTVIREAKVNPATREMAYFVEGDPQAVQIVEFFGEDPEEATGRARAFSQAMQAQGIGYAWPVFAEAAGVRDVWETRKLGLGLISNVKGPNKGRDFIEDACVPTKHLAEYIGKIETLCHEQGIERISLYAHASVGVVH